MNKLTATVREKDWLLISPLLDHALSLDAEERRVWMQKQEPEIAERLEMLLLEHSVLASDGFLEHAVVPTPSTSASLAGQTVGHFEVLSQIGQGGMGSVWLGRRNDGRFERLAALKFLNIALLGKQGEDRFKREGNILARLSDPHIAELMDAGVTHAGQPYLVLEYVAGDHIDRYCDLHRLDVHERVRLFLQVLDGVATAHANLVVHRDLKPSNILVRKDGQVKLLDFGIAKLIESDERGTVQTGLTVGGTALTPEFAAPEQFKQETITASTDVYALGVLLYILLTGRHPAGDARSSPAELLKAAVETEPMKLSDAAATDDAANGDAAARANLRSTSPEKLARMLRGDLDTIVAHALKKDPRERYPAVSAFAEDLRRYLKSEPISARPDTLMYRTGKFVRRHRTVVTLGAIAVAGVALGIAATLLQARSVRTERDLAMRQLERAERMTDLNQLLLSDAAPVGRPLAVDQLLEREERVIEHERNPDPVNHVELQLSLGSQYSGEDQTEKALRVLNNAYSFSRDLKDPAIRAKASCVLAGALVPLGQLARAEDLFQEGLRELGNRPQFAPVRALCQLHGSEIAAQSGNSQEAIARGRSAEQAIQGSAVQWNLEGLNVLINLATVLGDAGKFREADQRFQEASRLMTQLGYDDSQKAVKLFTNWALTLAYDGRQLDAERIYNHALTISRTDETDNSAPPALLFHYASLLRELGRGKEARQYLEIAGTRAQALHDMVLADEVSLLKASMFTDSGQWDRASELLNRVEIELKKRYVPEHYVFAEISAERARMALARGNMMLGRPLCADGRGTG